jgi:hypothetical protein
MDDRSHAFGEAPGYEFDVPRGHGQPWPQPWPERRPPERPQERRPPERRPERPRQTWRPEADPAPGPGRPALLARDALAAMRARNWLTSLAAPLVAAIAVGIAAVVVLGANKGGDANAPSALAAGFPPARLAAADFGGGGGRPVEVAAIAAGGATEVAAGSASRGCALWVTVDGGSSWRRAALPAAVAGQADAGQLAGVADGPSGWLAVGGAAMRPVVIGSPNGLTWTATEGEAAFAGPGRTVTAGVAAGPGGYVIVGTASAGAGPRMVAAAWYAPGLTGWRRATDATDATGTAGALAGSGNQAMNAVTAVGRGFVAVGAAGARPAAWRSATGRTWTLVTLPLPAGAASAALDYVAANGGVLAAVGTEITAAGQRRPFAAVSTDAGADWTQAPLPLPAGDPADTTTAGTAAATALTAAGGGFTATGTYGRPGETDVVVWTLPAGSGAGTGGAGGTGWTEAAPPGTGLAGPGVQAITALTATGATLTGVGFTATSGPTSATMATEPTIWQSPVRS